MPPHPQICHGHLSTWIAHTSWQGLSRSRASVLKKEWEAWVSQGPSVRLCLKGENDAAWLPVWNPFQITHKTPQYSFFFFFQIYHSFLYLFIYLFLAVLGLNFCERAFSSCGERGPLPVAASGPLTVVASLVAEHKLQTHTLSSCGLGAQSLRGMWDPPGPGLEPMFPALAGRLSTTVPPGKPAPQYSFFFFFFSPIFLKKKKDWTISVSSTSFFWCVLFPYTYDIVF